MEHPADAARTTPAPRPIAALVVLSYLVVTLPLVLRNGVTAATIALFVTHAAMIAALYVTWRNPPASRLRVVADWLPLVLLPALYAELPYLMPIGGDGTIVFRDPVVIAWEHALFGMQPASVLAGAWPSRALSELLHFGYLSYYALIFVPAFLLYARGDRTGFTLSAAAVMGSFAVCFVVFALWPVEGPRYRYPAPAGAVDGPIRALVLAILERGSSRGAAFPSSHAAAAVAQSLVLLRIRPRLGTVVSTLTALLLVGAVYGGFHYGVDMAVGTLVGGLAAAVAFRHVARPSVLAPVVTRASDRRFSGAA